MYNDNDFQEFRGWALEEAKKMNDKLIKDWLQQIDYHETVGYYIDHYKCTIEIYTKNPGILIGKAGCNIEFLENIVSKEYCRKYKVSFKEVKGGFVCIDREVKVIVFNYIL